MKIGILSDTHISEISPVFLENTKKAFTDCDIIVHAGDLTDIAILSVFAGKKVYAVAGNCCNIRTSQNLPHHTRFELEGKLFVITHGAGGPRHNIEDRLFNAYPEADCIIYGHTHIPVAHKTGGIYFINPGSFKSTGTFGAPGTYAIAEVDDAEISAKILEIS